MYCTTRSVQKRTISLIPVRIGALLINSGLLRPHEMHSALVCARQTGRRIGDVLLAQNSINAAEFQVALEIQRLIKDGSLTVEMGTKALRLYHQKPMPLPELLASVGYSQVKTISNQDLADILLSAECITQAQLDQARWNAAKNELPLGRNLVLAGAISPSTLGTALSLLTLLRERRLSEDAAVAALKQVVTNRVALEEVLAINESHPHHVRVGELLSLAGLLSESDAMIAVEQGLLNRQCIGQTLLQLKMVSPLVLDAVLKLQNMLDEHTIKKEQAAELLRQVAAKELALEDCLTTMARLRAQVLELLLESGVVGDEHVQSALGASPSFETDILRALFASGSIDQDIFRAAVRCVYAINEGCYTREQALVWLQYEFKQPAADRAELSA